MTRKSLLLAVTALVMSACGVGDTAEDGDTATTAVPGTTTTQVSTTAATQPLTTTTEVQGPVGDLASIRAALSQSAQITSGRMEGLIEITGAVDGGMTMDMSLPFGGVFNTVTGNSSFFIDLSDFAEAGAEEIPAEFADLFGEMEVRNIDGISYVRFPLFTLLLGSGTAWISSPADEGGNLTGDFMFTHPGNPAEILEALEEVDAEVTEIRRETVNGVQTTHYRAIFDSSKLYAEATADQLAELDDQGLIPNGTFPVDMWITDDGLIVRYVMDIDGTAISSTPGEEFERMVVTYDLFDINQPVQIVAPDSADVTDLEELGAGFFGFEG
jgi:hypothetical protein